MRHLVWSFSTGTALLLAGLAHAQMPGSPAQSAAAPPPPTEYGTPITAEQAKKVAEASITEAGKNNWRMAVAVTEPDGSLVYFEKMDGTQYASGDIAQGKARSAARFRRSTKVFQDALAAGNNYYLSFPGLVPSEGGLPILVGGKIIGAVGASGGSGQQDGMAALAGVNALK
jgi:glc operon protein GlcG